MALQLNMLVQTDSLSSYVWAVWVSLAGRLLLLLSSFRFFGTTSRIASFSQVEFWANLFIFYFLLKTQRKLIIGSPKCYCKNAVDENRKDSSAIILKNFNILRVFRHSISIRLNLFVSA